MRFTTTHVRTRISHRFLPVFVLLLTIGAPVAVAQTSATDGTTPAALDPGAPAGSYGLSEFEHINLFNGNLSASFKLVHIGGRGSAAYTMTLPIEQHWRSINGSFDPFNSGNLVYYSGAESNWWEGIRPGYSPGVVQSRTVGSQPGNCNPQQYGGLFNSLVLTRLTFTGPDGSEHELVDAQTNGAPHVFGICGFQTFSRGKIFISKDGSATTFISDQPIVEDNTTSIVGVATGVLLFSDGTRYRVDGGLVTWIRDRNGNRVDFTYGTNPNDAITYQRLVSLTDSLDRQVTISYANNSTIFYDQINFKGFGGASRAIRIHYSSLGQALRTGYALTNYYHLFPEYNSNPNDPNLYNPTVVSRLELPDGRSYEFRYNQYAELARVTLPTSGAIEYDHTAGSGVLCYISDCTMSEIYRRTIERRVFSDGTPSSFESKTTYSSGVVGMTSANPEIVDHLNAAGTLLAREQHYYFGNAVPSSLQPVYWSAWNSGREYQTDYMSVVNGVSGSALKREEFLWQQRDIVSWCTAQVGCTQASAPPNDPRLVQTTTTLVDTNQVSKTTCLNPQNNQAMMDQFNNETDTWVYDYGSGAPGNLLRRIHVDYVTLNSVNGIDYTDRTTTTTPHILRLPRQVSIFDGSGVERGRSVVEYDGYSGTNHAALVTRLNISGLDPTSTSTYLSRGNATASTRYLLTNGSVTGSVTTYSQYDVAGNKVKFIDARGYQTVLDYTDRFGTPDDEAQGNAGGPELNNASHISYAYATQATNAMGQTAYSQYDYYLGLTVNSQDANGIVSSIFYNDSLDRPTQSVRGANQAAGLKSQETFAYDDVNHLVSITSDQTTFNDNVLKSQQVYDGLGRTIEQRTFEGGSNYITTQQQYDSFSRVYKTSNPFRPLQGESAIWTITTFDCLGRATFVTTPDNAVSETTYSGNRTLIKDQIGRERLSLQNAIGNLKDVWEITASDSASEPVSFPNHPEITAAYRTSYNYDALDNLILVTQGTQTRTFAYDSLKRMTSSAVPESGTISYSYDNNGNQTSQTDSRNITTNYSYDPLNRRTSKTYVNDPNNTPAVNYFYDDQTLPGTPPVFTKGASVNRLIAVTYGGGSTGDYFGYDALGRFVLKIQQLGGINYQIQRTYDLSGKLKAHTYPSNHVVNYSYDSAGRALSVSGTLGDGTGRNYSTGIIYTSMGGMAKEQFGTDQPVYNKRFYNIRGQLAEIRESTSYTDPTDTTWNRGAIVNHYSYQCWGMCTGFSMTDNDGNLKKQDVYIPDNDQISTYTARWQEYNYDSLNRLNWVREISNGTESWRQSFTYDRFGNRTINQAGTTQGIGLNSMQAQVVPQTTTNRMYAPGETQVSHPLINYDNAGNQTKDYYTDSSIGIVYDRTYDAENRMTTSVATYSSPAGTVTSTYSYDGQGNRVKRTVGGNETWQVYDVDGQLLAEYAANGAASNPKKEYGYRNAELLVTAEPSSSMNGYSYQRAITIDHTKVPNTDQSNFPLLVKGTYAYLATATNGGNVQNANGYDVIFTSDAGCSAKLAHEVESYSASTGAVNYWVKVPTVSHTSDTMIYLCYGNPSISTDQSNRTAVWDSNFKGVWHMKDNAANPTVSDSTGVNNGTNQANTSSKTGNGQVGNALVYNGNSDYTDMGSNVGGYVLSDSFTVEAWVNPALDSANRAIFGNAYAAAGYLLRINTENKVRFLVITNGSNYSGRDSSVLSPGWHHVVGVWTGSGTPHVYVDGVLNDATALSSGTVTTISTSAHTRIGEAPETGFECYFNGTIDEVHSSKTARSADWIRTEYNNQSSPATFYSIVASGGTQTTKINWLVTDQLGTPRIILDQSGSLVGVKRHDYLPFGEELFAPIGGRTTTQGYTSDPALRQRFTQYERDTESGLDYAHARYYSSVAGRFTSPDPLLGSAKAPVPQSWNRYTYVLNNPVNYSDPTGLNGDWYYDATMPTSVPKWFDSDPGGNWKRWTDTYGYVYRDTAKTGLWVALDPHHDQAFISNSETRAAQAFEAFLYNRFGLIPATKAQREYFGGFTEGLSPLGPAVFLLNHAEGMDTSSREYKAGLIVGILLGAGVNEVGNAVGVIRELTPTSRAVAEAERALKNGATEVTVKSEEEAAEVYLRNYHQEGYHNTTGMTGNEVRNDKFVFPDGKSGTYHWDLADTEHGGRPHLQIETREGTKIRIFIDPNLN